MVPDSYTDFFVASAGVAGALIGLLFVAISVAPEPTTAEQRLDLDTRAGVAFSALTDALVVSLFAVVPGVNLGIPALASGLGGLASCIAIGVVLWRAGRSGGRGRKLRLLALQSLVFVYQVAAAAQLIDDDHNEMAIRTLAILTVVIFLVGIARAWELIGARDASLIRTVRQVIHERPAAETPSGPDSPAPPPG
ncbi:MAG TPA: hypothetical protein VHW47_10145 [Acidimicrobiales bacterium]|jgi:hypothetical protein|nr:hypothetical protein [Acidimicrobiales bacterium]